MFLCIFVLGSSIKTFGKFNSLTTNKKAFEEPPVESDINLLAALGAMIDSLMPQLEVLYDYKLSNDHESYNHLKEIFRELDPDKKVSESLIFGDLFTQFAELAPYINSPLKTILEKDPTIDVGVIQEGLINTLAKPISYVWKGGDFEKGINTLFFTSIRQGLKEMGINIDKFCELFLINNFNTATTSDIFRQCFGIEYKEIYDSLNDKIFNQDKLNLKGFSSFASDLEKLVKVVPGFLNKLSAAISDVVKPFYHSILDKNVRNNARKAADGIPLDNVDLESLRKFLVDLSNGKLNINFDARKKLLEQVPPSSSSPIDLIMELLYAMGQPGGIRKELIKMSEGLAYEFKVAFIDLINFLGNRNQQFPPTILGQVNMLMASIMLENALNLGYMFMGN